MNGNGGVNEIIRHRIYHPYLLVLCRAHLRSALAASFIRYLSLSSGWLRSFCREVLEERENEEPVLLLTTGADLQHLGEKLRWLPVAL
jgi:hypothetical protein